MIVEFYDRQDELNPLNGTKVSNATHLLQIIDSLGARSPFFCELIGENGFDLLLGIGGAIGCAQYSRHDGSTPYLMATTPDSKRNNEHAKFLIGSTTTPIAARYCLPSNLIEEIAVYFQETGGRTPRVAWEEI